MFAWSAWSVGASEALVLLACLLAIVYANSRKPIKNGPGGFTRPPGPKGIPLLGYLTFLGKDATVKFNELRKTFGDIFSIDMGSQRTVVVNGLTLIRQFMHSELVSDRPALKSFNCINEGRSVSFINYGPSYKIHRKICIKALADLTNVNRGPLQKMLKSSGEILCRMLEKQLGKSADPSFPVHTAVMSVVFKLAFGPDLAPEGCEDFDIMRDELIKFDSAVGWCAPADFLTFLQPLLKGKYEAFRQINKNYTAAIQRRIDYHTDTYEEGVKRDSLDCLIHCMKIYKTKLDQLGLTERDILHSVQDFVGAGTENTTQAVLWILQYLAKYPDAQQAVIDEIREVCGESEVCLDDRKRLPKVWSFVLEVMRCRHTSPIAIPRAAAQDFTYDGYYIAQGTMVIGNLNSIFRDEELFPEPDEFKPTRFIKTDGGVDFELVNKLPLFGMGNRRCLGQLLAQNELFYFTVTLVQNFVMKEDPKNPLTLAGYLQMIFKPDLFKVIIEKREQQ